ncbi:MAG: GTP-binding protein [Hyphomicrobiales bacterium]
MVVVSYSGREINAKIVYYGPGLSGKTTNLEKIYDSVPESNRGRMVSMKTQTDRTLFFDLLPLDLGELSGMKTRFLLYTVPGQVYYNATRKLVLKGVDAVVFVADSAPDKMAENRESLTNLETNLKSYGLDLKTLPWVIQLNKRDLPNALSVDEMNKELNRHRVPTYEAQAANGVGVFETLRGVSKLLLAKISKDVMERDRGSLAASARATNEEASNPPQAAEEAPPISAAEPKKGRGKLMEFLKRGKGEEEAPAAASAPPDAAPEPILSEDALVEEPAAPVTADYYVERNPFSEAPVEPAPSAADEELVLSGDDLVVEREESSPPAAAPEPDPEIIRAEDGDAFFSEGEIQRESSYEADRGAAVRASGGVITVPIDLGDLPAKGGRLRLTFEIKVEIVDGSGAKRSKRHTHMRDLEEVS